MSAPNDLAFQADRGPPHGMGPSRLNGRNPSVCGRYPGRRTVMQKIRYAVIGLGWFGESTARRSLFRRRTRARSNRQNQHRTFSINGVIPDAGLSSRNKVLAVDGESLLDADLRLLRFMLVLLQRFGRNAAKAGEAPPLVGWPAYPPHWFHSIHHHPTLPITSAAGVVA